MAQQKINIFAVIPARGGSKGIPRKNIAPLGGKPLIYYSIREAKKSKLIDACIVSTDDLEIAEISRSYGADVPFLRPKKYARDTSRDIEFLQHAVQWVKKHRGWEPEIVLFLQPTSPSRTAEDIDAVLNSMIQKQADSVRTFVEPKSHNPFKMWIEKDKKNGSFKPLFSHARGGGPRQLLPKYYAPVGLVYATRRRFIESGELWGPNMHCVLMDKKKYIDIDEPDDLNMAEISMRHLGLLD